MSGLQKFLFLIALLSAAALFVLFVEDREFDQEEKKEPSELSEVEIPDKISISVIKNESAKILPGYTLLPLSGSEKIVLINHGGEILHSWNLDAARARLLPNGNILVIHGSQWGKDVSPWSELENRVREYSWEGELVWEYEAPNKVQRDLLRLPNGNTLFLTRTSTLFPPPTNPAKQKVFGTEPRKIRSDRILEVTKEKDIVWQWDAYEHLDVYTCGTRSCNNPYEQRAIRRKLFDWMHGNTLTLIPENHWFKVGDSRFKPGNLILLPRNFWQVLLIDKKTGDIVWKYPEGKTELPLKEDRLVRGHEAHMIEEGLPGAGNILIFDNGLDEVREHSIVREINPVTHQTVWRYEADGFYGHAGGSVQRLENGNTLISQDRGEARVFEVDSKGEIVWDLELSHFPARAGRYKPDFCMQFLGFNREGRDEREG